MEDKKKKTTQTDLLVRYVKEKAKNHNIPLILIGRDEKDQGFCFVGDDEDNVSMLIEAIAHCEALRKAVLEAFAKLLAASPSLETKLMAAVAKFRNQNKREKV